MNLRDFSLLELVRMMHPVIYEEIYRNARFAPIGGLRPAAAGRIKEFFQQTSIVGIVLTSRAFVPRNDPGASCQIHWSRRP